MTEEWACDTHSWVAIGVTTWNGMMTRVWKCGSCPAWTQQGYGRKYEVEYHETEMHGADNATKSGENE